MGIGSHDCRRPPNARDLVERAVDIQIGLIPSLTRMPGGNQLIYAIDFDGTIVKHDYPHVGEPVPGALAGMRELVKEGHQIILYTMRDGKELDAAVAYLEDAGIPLFGVNENPAQTWSSSPTVSYTHLTLPTKA